MADCATCDAAGCPRRESGLPPGMAERYDLEAPRFDGSLAWIETDRDAEGLPSVSEASKEVLGMLGGLCDGRLWGIVFGHAELKPLYPEIFSYGVETLYEVHSRDLVEFDLGSYAEAIAQIAERTGAALIAMADTEKGRMLAQAIPLKERRGLALGCSSVDVGLCGLRADTDLGPVVRDGFPQVITVKPGSYPAAPEGACRQGTVIYWRYRPR